jgi:hypothetical protein
LPELIKLMNRKLIIKAVLLNSCVVIGSVILGLIIINAFARHLFNLNVEDYLFLIASAAGLPVSFFVYKKAVSKKTLHAATVYLLTQVTVGLIILVLFLLLFLAIKIYCANSPCRIIPFL